MEKKQGIRLRCNLGHKSCGDWQRMALKQDLEIAPAIHGMGSLQTCVKVRETRPLSAEIDCRKGL